MLKLKGVYTHKAIREAIHKEELSQVKHAFDRLLREVKLNHVANEDTLFATIAVLVITCSSINDIELTFASDINCIKDTIRYNKLYPLPPFPGEEV